MATPQEIRHGIHRVRAALASKALVAFQTHYLLQDGRIHAQNGRVQASAPCLIPGEFLVSGAEFERAIDKLPVDKLVIEQDLDAGTMLIKGGRFRTTIQTMDVVLYNQKEFTTAPVQFDRDKFLYALDALRPFISDNATRPFALCYNFTQGRAMATNNVVITECLDTGVDPEVSFLLPQWAADYILSMHDEPITSMGIGINCMGVMWADGTTMNTYLGGQTWPESAARIVSAVTPAKHKVSDDWRRDVLVLRDLGENEITFRADRIEVGRGRSNTRLEVATPVPEGKEYSRWTFEYLDPILERATHIDFANWPSPLTFRWKNVRGLMAARK